MLTPCNAGSGFLQILDWGKFALTGYNRMTLSEVKAWVKSERLHYYKLVRQWFKSSSKPQLKPPLEEMAAEIVAGHQDYLEKRPARLPFTKDQWTRTHRPMP